MRRFSQVDVFSTGGLLGNPVAVVHDAEGLDDETMARFARWTNLSETTFLLPPTDAVADYRLRIFTPGRELPFAGHPTLGSAHAWLESGGEPRHENEVVQQCGAGLVRLRRGTRLAFAAPPLRRSGSVDPSDLDTIRRALGIETDALVDAAWADNGPGWVAVLLRDAETVLGLTPDLGVLGDLRVGVVGEYAGSGDTGDIDDPRVEVRAFVPSMGIAEDPVTGSLNAAIGQWLAGRRLPSSYVASQGTVLGRRGRVHVSLEGDPASGTVWIGGDTHTTVVGDVDL